MAQGIWTPGGSFDRQPQGPVEVDWANPIARNLSISVPLGGDTRNIVPGVSPQTASSGHKIAASSIGQVSEFTGTTNGIVHAFDAPSFPITISALIFASGSGGGAVCALTGPFGGDNWWTHTLEVSATQIFSNTAAGGGTDASINYALPAVGRWYHAALVVASATDRRLYVNGELVGTSTASRSFPAFAEARIGSIGGNWGGASKLVGLAADVNVWRRALVLPEIQFISGVQWPLLRDTSDILIFDMGAGGGTSQTIAFTLDDLTSSVSQTLSHSQSAAFTLDGISSTVNQAVTHSQSLSATLDDVTASISQELAGAKSQSIAFTLDGITASVSQTASHSQSLAATLDDVTVSISQSAAPSSKDQSLAITLDDIFVDIKQAGPRRRQAGGKRNYIIKGKKYHLNDYELAVMIQGMLEEVERSDVEIDDGEAVKKVSRRVWKQLKESNAQLDFTLKELQSKVAIQEIDDEDDIALLML